MQTRPFVCGVQCASVFLRFHAGQRLFAQVRRRWVLFFVCYPLVRHDFHLSCLYLFAPRMYAQNRQTQALTFRSVTTATHIYTLQKLKVLPNLPLLPVTLCPLLVTRHGHVLVRLQVPASVALGLRGNLSLPCMRRTIGCELARILQLLSHNDALCRLLVPAMRTKLPTSCNSSRTMLSNEVR